MLKASTERLDGTHSATAQTDKGIHQTQSGTFCWNTHKLVLTGVDGGGGWVKGGKREGLGI